MKAAVSSDIMVPFYPTTRRHFSKDSNPCLCRVWLKFRALYSFNKQHKWIKSEGRESFLVYRSKWSM